MFGRGGVLQPLFLSISTGGSERWEFADSPISRGGERLKVFSRFCQHDCPSLLHRFATLGVYLNRPNIYRNNAYHILLRGGMGRMFGLEVMGFVDKDSGAVDTGVRFAGGGAGIEAQWRERGDFNVWFFEPHVDANFTSPASIWYGTQRVDGSFPVEVPEEEMLAQAGAGVGWVADDDGVRIPVPDDGSDDGWGKEWVVGVGGDAVPLRAGIPAVGGPSPSSVEFHGALGEISVDDSF